MFGTPQRIRLKDSTLLKKLLSNSEIDEELQKLCDQNNSAKREDEYLPLVKEHR